MEPNEKNSSFTFLVDNHNIPKITINSDKLAVVKCVYYWETSTDSNGCKSYATVSGYINGENKLRIFELDFITNKVKEITR